MSVSCKHTGIKLAIALDNEIIWQGDPGNPQQIVHEFDDADNADHLLTITLSGKLPKHTEVDDQGNIVSDLLVNVSQFSLESVPIDHVVWRQSKYYHDFNGTQPSITDEFFGDMGCNGRVEFKFSSPVYIWLLENT